MSWMSDSQKFQNALLFHYSYLANVVITFFERKAAIGG
jgi:hypothetical protein